MRDTISYINHNAKWTVSLSNGETLFEGKGDYCWIEGALSPWLRMKEYLKEKDLKITSLALYTDNNRRYNLPSAGSNPNFTAFFNAEKPKDYNCFRTVSEIKLNKKIKSHFTVIEALYNTYKLQLWVDEFNPDNCWVLLCQN